MPDLRMRQLAHELGVSYETMARGWRRLVDAGMPAPANAIKGAKPIATIGRPRWEPSGWHAWHRRHHPQAPPPANDPHETLADEAAWQAALAAEYGAKQ